MAFPAPTLPGQLKSSVVAAPGLLPRFDRKYTLKNNRRRRARVVLGAANSEEASCEAIFGGQKELSGPEKVLQGLSAPARYGACAAIVAGALAGGYAVGSTRNAAVGGAVALGLAGGAAAYALNSSAPRIAAVTVHNAVASCAHPTDLTSEAINSILHKYGVSKQDEAFNAELRDLYDRYVSSVIPPGNEDLKGNEADVITQFKNALGIDDPDAAAVHIEIGRRMFRQRLETGDRDAVTEERRAFQKLVYISNIIFGDASKFLLPWKRVFNITDAQIEVAIRDNAQTLFKSTLSFLGRDLDERQLRNLREEQVKLKLPDEDAADLVRDYARRQIEEMISSALEILKSKGRAKGSSTGVVEELDKILAYNHALIALTQRADKEHFPPGIGPVSVIGGEYDRDRKMDELMLLYRAYLTEALSTGRIEDEKFEALNHLKNIFGLGNRETEQIVLEITTKAYRRRLSQVVSGGDLEAAPSKAAFLQRLCDELHFNPQKASEVHADIYRQKLQQCVADGDLSEEDVAALLRLRVLLCIPQKTVDAAHEDICGRLFQKVVDQALSAGINGYDEQMRASVQKAVRGLRLAEETAVAITSKTVRAMFRIYVKRSKAVENQAEAARELKKMIHFNDKVVTELLADIKGYSSVVSPELPKEEPKKEKDDEFSEKLKMPRQVKDYKPREQIQTEITLKDDLSLRDRTDLYRTYFQYCITGEPVGRQFGMQVRKRVDKTEFLRLKQLREILGLTQEESSVVHISYSEQAFRKKAEVILADGQLSKERMEILNELQKQLELPDESAQKIIKSITKTKISGAIEAALSQGKITIEQIRKLREANVDMDEVISEGVRENVFKKIIDGIFSSGTGDFNEKDVYERIPEDLGMDASKCKKLVQDSAKERLSNTLVQAAAFLRQKNSSGVVSSLNNLLACDKALPAEPLSWSIEEEVADFFCIYLKGNPPKENIDRLQYLLGIDESTALSLKDSGAFSLGAEEEEFVF
ncbi:hypothetical protein SUGI_0921430 [Cryptomeria japonica]|uniref:protein TIC110, chloroplastic n=1 Tax=Cryptomeria japonica TaxID=3369 RepID=UPI002414B1B8|nr:protein TIC110, chloroplastic [Cryptomeria japonica]GLJ44162.1 hypothetical protein SUGI_0921430 [Cryptomeria japonica]